MATLVPHVLPFALYLGVGAAGGPLGPWVDVVRVVLVLGALLFFGRRGAYAELVQRPTAGAALVGLLLGLAIGAAWVPLAELVPPLTATERTGLDPAAGLLPTVARVAAMVLAIPLAEELFDRSALPRFVDAKPDEDWRKRAIGSFTALSAAVSVAFFTLTHPEWLAALASGVAWTAFLARTKSFSALVLSHAAANAWVAGYVLVTGDKRWW